MVYLLRCTSLVGAQCGRISLVGALRGLKRGKEEGRHGLVAGAPLVQDDDVEDVDTAANGSDERGCDVITRGGCRTAASLVGLRLIT